MNKYEFYATGIFLILIWADTQAEAIVNFKLLYPEITNYRVALRKFVT